jgi:DNA-binding MarR family transcriptional regulator
MVPDDPSSRSERRPAGVAFLLAQLGAHAANRFAERVAAIGLTPAHAGILWKIGSDAGIGQQALAAHLHVMPSRIVVLIDELEDKGIVERRRSAEDRRNYNLVLTAKGRSALAELARIAAEHEEDVSRALDRKEKALLKALCQKVADQQGLTAGVHPGYRHLGDKKP